MLAKGKVPDWEVAAAAIIDLELVKKSIVHLIERLAENYKTILDQRSQRDYQAQTVEVIDYLKANASGVVEKVTHRVASAVPSS